MHVRAQCMYTPCVALTGSLLPPGLADHLVDEYLLALRQVSDGRRQNGLRVS